MRTPLVSAFLALLVAGCGIFTTGDGGGHTKAKGGVGDPCAADSACRDGLSCDSDGECAPSGDVKKGDACTLTASCDDGLYCDHTRTCAKAGDGKEDEKCRTTADCEAGLLCSFAGLGAVCVPAGEGDVDDDCAHTTDCLAGLTCGADLGGPALCIDASATDGDAPPPLPPPWTGARCPVEADNMPRALFELPNDDQEDDFYRLPFPNDIRLTVSGIDMGGHPSPGAALTSNIVDRYLDALGTDVHGFATNPVIYFRFTHEAKVTLDNIDIINLDDGTVHSSKRYARTGGAGPVDNYTCPYLVMIAPAHGTPLLPGTHYAAIIRNGAVPSDANVGASFERSSMLETLLAEEAPADGAEKAAWDAYAPLRTWLDGHPSERDTLLNAAVFTTQPVEDTVSKMREVIRAGDTPAVSDLTYCDTGVKSPCDDGTEARKCGAANDDYVELHGHIALPIFQDGTAPYEKLDDGGGIAKDGDGLPTVTRTEEVCFALTVPKTGTMPGNGWPVVIYGHGTGGSFRSPQADGIATAAANGTLGDTPVHAATLAIDLPAHGARKNGSKTTSEELFYNFMNPAAARGNVLQGAADLLSLVYFVRTGQIGAQASPTNARIAFNAARIVVYGHSQGSTHASIMLPFEADVSAAVLSGNGGDLTLSLLHKSKPVDIAAAIPYALFDVNDKGTVAGGDLHPVLALFQTYFEEADPVNYARRLRRDPVGGGAPKAHVFMTYGVGDSYSPEQTMEAYARAARLPLVTPRLVDEYFSKKDSPALAEAAPPLSANFTGKTLGLRQYTPDGDDDGHFVATSTAKGSADVTRFMLGALAGQTPAIGE